MEKGEQDLGRFRRSGCERSRVRSQAGRLAPEIDKALLRSWGPDAPIPNDSLPSEFQDSPGSEEGQP